MIKDPFNRKRFYYVFCDSGDVRLVDISFLMILLLHIGDQ